MGRMVKTAHFYWAGRPLSWLRFATLLTFRKLHPEWKMKLWLPTVVSANKPGWVDPPHKTPYVGHDWRENYDEIPGLEICEVDLVKIGFRNDAHCAVKSDYLRWHLLGTEGGLWSDMDMIWTDRVPESEIRNTDWLIATIPGEFPLMYQIGYIYGSEGCPVGVDLRGAARSAYNPNSYQCLGSPLITQQYPYLPYYEKKHPGIVARMVSPKIYIPIQWMFTERLFLPDLPVNYDASIAIHWFGGHPLAAMWENHITPVNLPDIPLVGWIRRVLCL